MSVDGGDAAHRAQDDRPAGEQTPSEVAGPKAAHQPDDAPAGPPPPRRRGMGSLRSMVISTVIVVLAALAWWAFVPRSDQPTQPVADIGGIAREVGISQHWDPAIADGLPAGWKPVNVRLVQADGLPDTWQAGYDVTDGNYIRVLQTERSSDRWVHEQTGSGTPQGSVTIDGVAWRKVARGDGGERSLVRSAPLAGLATVVDGTADWSQLKRFAASLTPLSKSSLATTKPSASAS